MFKLGKETCEKITTSLCSVGRFYLFKDLLGNMQNKQQGLSIYNKI